MKNFKSLFILPFLAACVDPTIELNTLDNNLRNTVMNDVAQMASTTGEYHKKYGSKKTIDAVLSHARDEMKDPDGVKFKDIRLVDYYGGKVVCGNLNGKNSYGAYVGFKAFVAGINDTMMYSTSEYPGVSDTANAGLRAACGG